MKPKGTRNAHSDYFGNFWSKNYDKSAEDLFKLFFSVRNIPKYFKKEKMRIKLFREQLFLHMRAFKVAFTEKKYTDLKKDELPERKSHFICKKSPNCPGLGVFANVPIKAGTRKKHLVGFKKRISRSQYENLKRLQHTSLTFMPNNGIFKPKEENPDVEEVEEYSSNTSYFVLYGPLKYLNSACEGVFNLEVDHKWKYTEALRDIAEGEELFIHYGDTYFDGENLRCTNKKCKHD